MLTSSFIIILIILITVAILYKKYHEKNSIYSEEKTYKYLRKYVLKETSIPSSKKPIMWIYVPYEYNSRNWQSFGSRSSFDINQPYLYLTVKTIIKNCDESFTICLIDDESFTKLLPDLNINLKQIADPILTHIRQLLLAKLVYNYGGIIVPISFLCFKNLDKLFNNGTKHDSMFIGENIDSNITSINHDFYPNIGFMGAKKENKTVKELIDFMQRTISSDYTAEVDFLGDFNRWCNTRVNSGKINLIDGTLIGTKTMDDEPVLIENLLGEDYINYYNDMYGIWIPASMILKRTNYNWFARMSVEQVLKGNFILAKYLLLASAPDSHIGVIEPLTSKPDWVGFWKVPSGAPMWGLMPLGLGDNVPKVKNG